MQMSCSFVREYFLCEEAYLSQCNDISCMNELEQHGQWLKVYGMDFPIIEKADGYAPYEIKSVEAYQIRKKKAKTLIVYE